MEIGSNQPFVGPEYSANANAYTSSKPESPHSFASFLNTQGDTAQNVLVSTENDAGRSPGVSEEDIEFIRKNGFQAYLERDGERKLEEMRAQILGQMGLSEASLAAMPVEQRAQMEKLIAEEMQARLAAEAELNGGSERHGNAVVGPGDAAPKPMTLLESSRPVQAMVGFSIVDAVRGPDRLDGEYRNRQFLPADD